MDEALARRPAGTRLPVVHWVRLFEAYGLSVADVQAVRSVEHALEAAALLGFPVVLRHVPQGTVTVTSPDELRRVAPAGEFFLHRDLGSTTPALLWTTDVATRVARLRRELPEIDELDLVVEVDGWGRSWVVDATVHVRPVSDPADGAR